LKKFNPILDGREDYSAGWKFSRMGIERNSIRIEIGLKI
jgi:hypothetical protein